MRRRLSGRTVLLGVTGSIAAYKACEIASRLVEHGASVIPALTRSARELVGPASLEAVTGHRAILEMFERPVPPEIEHIAVARRADLFLIAPATANILAKAAHGIADDWLSTTLLATRAPLLFAPAMNTDMWTHPATRDNVALLKQRVALFVGPGSGRLACGTEGEGRLIETSAILEAAAMALTREKDLAGKTVLITSGANHEPLDPVRYLGNRSTGRMGHAVALAALCRGARVVVVAGPSEVPPPHAAEVVRVETALEMRDAVMERLDGADVFIAAAAVADYRPETRHQAKMKRGGGSLTLSLVPNPDIAAEAGRRRRAGQVLVGFAAETDNVPDHGQGKLQAKGLDLLVANRVGGDGCAIGSDESEAWLVGAENGPLSLGRLGKDALADALLDAAAARLAPAD
ncbi:MAG: bifunctional phosphopantothenoylcysteine decarboxylase/phosphopantothenate--cysteine ligase CoaBC [Candidatus Hydrogenedens sp.]|nr:bifunctional phosphopantothenoylcysteine decarboxylase/phosphopantothenate--cysteine ligase CoaBC [Candidatus Hydrogenedens sp.]